MDRGTGKDMIILVKGKVAIFKIIFKFSETHCFSFQVCACPLSLALGALRIRVVNVTSWKGMDCPRPKLLARPGPLLLRSAALFD